MLVEHTAWHWYIIRTPLNLSEAASKHSSNIAILYTSQNARMSNDKQSSGAGARYADIAPSLFSAIYADTISSQTNRKENFQNYALQGVGSWDSEDSSTQNTASQNHESESSAAQANQNGSTENPLDRFLNERPQDSGPVMLWLGSHGKNGGA